jgi:hypothetical protein
MKIALRMTQGCNCVHDQVVSMRTKVLSMLCAVSQGCRWDRQVWLHRRHPCQRHQHLRRRAQRESGTSKCDRLLPIAVPLSVLDQSAVISEAFHNGIIKAPPRVLQSVGSLYPKVSSCCAQIYAIYDYQVAYGVRLATENPYVPTFGSDIPGGPPGLGVSSFVSYRIRLSICCRLCGHHPDRRFTCQRVACMMR